jgi:flagellar basal body-associated protein FliL
MGQDFNNAQFPQSSGDLPYQAPPKKSNRTVWIILIVVVLLLCCCCVIVVAGVATNMEGILQFLKDNGVNVESLMTVWLY